MQRDFPDELLSALLDDELSPAERAVVEQHLASSEADRQLLAELKSLRSDLASLPQVRVDPGFADRVVQAALAAAPQVAAVSQPAPAGTNLSWGVGLAVGVCALAATVLVLLWPWSPTSVTGPGGGVAVSPNQPPQSGNQFAAVLRQAAPAEGEALVLRLSIGKKENDASVSAALDAALAQVGISPVQPAADAAQSAGPLVRAYRTAVGAAGSGNPNGNAWARDALLVEAPLDSLELAFAGLAATVSEPLRLTPAARLALAGNGNMEAAEGEPGSAVKSAKITASGPSARRLPAKLFPLPSQSAAPMFSPSEHTLNSSPHRPVRVLLLIDQQ